MKSKNLNYEITPLDRIDIENLRRTFESIRYDFKKNMEMSDEEIEKLYPMLNLDFTGYWEAYTKLVNTSNQMLDMVIYCRRMLT